MVFKNKGLRIIFLTLIPILRLQRSGAHHFLKNFFLILIYVLCFQPLRIGHDAFEYYIVWNTGYGQWHTLIQNHTCLHIDLGGERLRFDPKIMSLCQRFPNQVFLTHLDRHHLNLSWFYKKWLNPSCSSFWTEFKNNKNLAHLLKNPSCPLHIQSSVSLYQKKFWVGGHTLVPLTPHHILTLSQHGALSSQTSKQAWKRHTTTAHMLIASKQLRRHTYNTKTDLWFKKHGRKLVYSHKWGHLIFHLN